MRRRVLLRCGVRKAGFLVALCVMCTAMPAWAAQAPPVPAAEPPAVTTADSITPFPLGAARLGHFDYTFWSLFLRRYVDNAGRVAYRDWLDDRSSFRKYIDTLGAATPSLWPREEQMAFWINAYNAGIVWAVLQGQSPETLIGRARLFKSWKFRVAGRDRTPDDIEHGILRKQFQDPRIHFALVCASTGCPPLRRAAYMPDSLTLQLDDQARRFVNDPLRNHLDADARVLELSSIFDWYRSDFERSAGSVPRFLAMYVYDARVREWLLGPVIPPPRYREYDWALNQQPFQRPERKTRAAH